jgi:MFS family permease
MPGSWGVVNRVARDRRLRRLELGFAGFAIAEHGTWLASVMYAYERGGVGEAGFAAFALLAPALLVAPIAAFAVDRFPSGRVLASGYAIQAVAMLATALAIATSAPAAFVYLAAALAASAVTLTRPAMGVLLPTVTRTPADLTAANVIIGFVEYTGMFVGPALTGVLVATSGLAAPFALCGTLTAGSAVLALGVRAEAGLGRRRTEGTRNGPIADTLEGLLALRAHRPVRTMMAMLSLGSLVIGVTDVLFVATADQLGGGDTSRAGLFGTAFGMGAMVGSVLSVVMIGRARITPFIATSIAAMGIALAALAATGGVAAAVVLYALIGGGGSVLRVASSTLIQRVAPSEVVGRFFGVAEGLHSFATAVGAGLIGVLVAQLGYETALIVAGCTIPALLALRISQLFRIDRDAQVPDQRVLELILGDDIFEALPAPVIERLANDARHRHLTAGSAATVQGEPGDHYFVIDRGRVDVVIDGRHVRELGPGAGFGELALVRDVPRSATVTAIGDVELLAFGRDEFLQAVGGHRQSSTTAGRRADRYLELPD